MNFNSLSSLLNIDALSANFNDAMKTINSREYFPISWKILSNVFVHWILDRNWIGQKFTTLKWFRREK